MQVAEENHRLKLQSSWLPADRKNVQCPVTMTHSGAQETKTVPLALKPANASDVFLRAPFGKKLQKSHAVSDNAPGRPLLPESPTHGARAPYVHVETPVLQQPVAVHRVVSRIGQQAAVGSVAVGPLHAWTITGRSLDDPFTAAPFPPRCSQGKP